MKKAKIIVFIFIDKKVRFDLECLKNNKKCKVSA